MAGIQDGYSNRQLRHEPPLSSKTDKTSENNLTEKSKEKKKHYEKMKMAANACQALAAAGSVVRFYMH